ncbi:MAG TPA: carboxy-S-adenosyl-L-methionine synthase CmoA [Candidatus Eisenbacteria bacterium]|nr:carboxy-S-adenosyl-L-methionine synthase CmoA [Candidatus Eisenbacteria bacterium]
MPKDEIFNQKKKLIEDFNFGKETAEVFDDMLDRSVPFYQEVQRMMAELCADFAVPGTRVYDLGCSTCTTFLQIDPKLPEGVVCVGVDSSQEMLQKAADKLAKSGFVRELQLEQGDLNKGIVIENASVVIMNLTLQFVRPLNREKVIRGIAQGLNPGGCLILIEKVLCQNSTLNRFFIKYYYEFKKRNGYSEMEISQKREALENVLVPYHFDENRELLLNNGFKACDIFFRWYNFCGMVALK